MRPGQGRRHGAARPPIALRVGGAGLVTGLGAAELSVTPRDIPAAWAVPRGLAACAPACGAAAQLRELEMRLDAMTRPAPQAAA